MSTTSPTGPALRAQIDAWLADDPDPADRAELATLLARWPASEPELADRFAGPLRFGTAGLRGPMRAGPNGMNLAVVRAAAAGLVRWLADQGADRTVGDRVRRPARLPAVRRSDRPSRHRRRPARAAAAASTAHSGARARGPGAVGRGRGDGDRQPQSTDGQRLQGLLGTGVRRRDRCGGADR